MASGHIAAACGANKLVSPIVLVLHACMRVDCSWRAANAPGCTAQQRSGARGGKVAQPRLHSLLASWQAQLRINDNRILLQRNTTVWASVHTARQHPQAGTLTGALTASCSVRTAAAQPRHS